MRRRVIAKREIRKRHRKRWKKILSHLESDNAKKKKPHAPEL